MNILSWLSVPLACGVGYGLIFYLHTVTHTYYHLLRTHLQEQHANNFKIAYFELLKNCPHTISLIIYYSDLWFLINMFGTTIILRSHQAFEIIHDI